MRHIVCVWGLPVINTLFNARVREQRLTPTRRRFLGVTAALAVLGFASPFALGKSQRVHAMQENEIPAQFLTSGAARWSGTLYDNRREFEKVVALQIEAGRVSTAEDPVQVGTLDIACPTFGSWRHSTLRLVWVNEEANMIGLSEITTDSSRCRGIGDSCCYPDTTVFAAEVVDDSTLRLASVEGPSMGWLTK